MVFFGCVNRHILYVNLYVNKWQTEDTYTWYPDVCLMESGASLTGFVFLCDMGILNNPIGLYESYMAIKSMSEW